MNRAQLRLALAIGILVACGSDSDPPTVAPQDAGVEAGRQDAGADASVDASNPSDGGGNPDVVADSSEAASDAPADAPVDALADAPVDAPADAPADTNVDAGPIDCVDGGTTTLAPGSGFTQISLYSDDAKLVLAGSIVGDGARRFWIQDPAGNGVSGDKVIDLASNKTSAEYVLAGSALCTVSQIARDSAGNAYVFSTGTNVILKTTPAGTVSSFSTAGNIGGGGNCNDTGVIGLLARADNTFFLGSPLNDKIYTLSADGVTRADFANVTKPIRLEHDGQNGLLVTAGFPPTKIMAVSATGTVTERLDVTGFAASAIRRDSNGDLYFGSGTRLYRSLSGTSTFREVAACFPGQITDIVFDHPSNDAGAGTSLYVLTLGTNPTAHDPGDALTELAR